MWSSPWPCSFMAPVRPDAFSFVVAVPPHACRSLSRSASDGILAADALKAFSKSLGIRARAPRWVHVGLLHAAAHARNRPGSRKRWRPMDTNRSENQAILLYDGECAMCREAVRWVSARVPAGRLAPVPCGSAEHTARAAQVPEQACHEAVQLVLPHGAVYAGAEALPHVLGMMRRWRWLGCVLRAPGIRAVTPVAYRAVARHRTVLSAFLVRKSGKAQCRPDRDCR